MNKKYIKLASILLKQLAFHYGWSMPKGAMDDWTAQEKRDFHKFLDDNFCDGDNHDPNNVCDRCGRHYLAHRKGEHCPKAKVNADGSKPKFRRK